MRSSIQRSISSSCSFESTSRDGSKSPRLPRAKRNVLRIFRYASLSCVITRSLIFTSAWYSTEPTQRRSKSAPHFSQISIGYSALPSDLDIGRPCSSSVQPCVTTPR